MVYHMFTMFYTMIYHMFTIVYIWYSTMVYHMFTTFLPQYTYGIPYIYHVVYVSTTVYFKHSSAPWLTR